MGYSAEEPVFVETSLGTHLAFNVHPDIIAGDFKSRLGSEHFSCFPNLGEIKIHALTVKRRSFYYHLPDSMPIRISCQGLSGSWFLFVDASRLQEMPRQEASICDLNHEELNQTNNGILMNDKGSLSNCRTPTTSVSEKVSVTGIISTYFPDYVEVSSCSRQPPEVKEKETMGITRKTERSNPSLVPDQASQDTEESVMNNNKRPRRRVNKRVVPNIPHSTPKMFSHPPRFTKQMKSSIHRAERYEVGKHLVQAAKRIGSSPSGEKLQRPMFIPMCGSLSMAKSIISVRNPTFEISDSDD